MDACSRKIRTGTAYLGGYVPSEALFKKRSVGPYVPGRGTPIRARHRLEQCVVSDTVEGSFAEHYWPFCFGVSDSRISPRSFFKDVRH
jgi:hypothetical protein